MNITFEGWRRKVVTHEHRVGYVNLSGDRPFSEGKKSRSDSIRFVSPLKAKGRLENLTLTGNFSIEIDFEESELEEWLEKYIEGKPKLALKMLSRMQQKAVDIVCSEKT